MDSRHGLFLALPFTDLPSQLACVPKPRIQDTVLIETSSSEHCVGIQALTRNTIDGVQSMVQAHALHNASGPVWGQIIEECFFAFANLVTAPPFQGATLEHLRYAIINDTYRKQLLKLCDDDKAKQFFQNTFQSLHKKGRLPSHSLDALLKPFTSGSTGAILNQLNPKLNLEDAVNQNKIIILHTDRLREGHTATNVLTSILTMLIIEAGKQPERINDLHHLFWIFLDEVHPFFNDFLANALVHTRNFGLRFVLGYQTLESFVNRSIRGRIITIPITFLFRVSAMDADYWQKETGMLPNQIGTLKNHEFLLRFQDKTYHLKSKPPLAPATSETIEKVREQTQRYTNKMPVYDYAYYQAILPKTQRKDKTV